MKNRLYRLIYYWMPFLLFLCLIYSFSSHPTTPTSEIYWEDFAVKKIAHISEYFLMSIFFYRALLSENMDKKKAGIIVIVFCILYASLDEFHQSFIPGREPRIRDVIFDTIGGILGIVIIWKYLPKAPKRLKGLAKNLELV